jgi:hypothetical protein
MRPPDWDDATWRLWKISVLKIVLLMLIVVASIVMVLIG